MTLPTPRHGSLLALSLLSFLAAAAPLAGCGSSSDSPPVEASPPVSSILPGEEIPADQALTLATTGSYGIPAGNFELVILCDRSVEFAAIVAANGTTTTGQCSTGITNAPVAGPGSLTLTFSDGASALLTLTPTSP